MWKRMLCGMLMMLGIVGTVWAQDRPEDDPGYVDLQTIERWFDAEPMIEVNIKGALLDLVAEASRYEDPDLASLLHKLQAIQVRGFSLRRTDFRDIEQQTSALAKRLESDGWDTVVRVREYDDDERVDVYVRVNETAIAGMMVMVIDSYEDEAIFVNIVGEINPSEIGRIGRRFDIDPLDDLDVVDDGF